MPHRKKKSFIEKKKAVTFHLVHRSQRDPLAADEKAPQHVLLQTANKVETDKRREEQRNFGVFFDDDYNYLQHLKEAAAATELVASGHTRTQRQHTREEDEEEEDVDMDEAGPASAINLPSSVFASEFEEEVGLLNKAAPISGPRLDMDPDIVAALDEDFDFDDPENQLDDDFILRASTGAMDTQGGEDDDDEEWEDTDDDEEGDFDSDGGLSGEEDGGGERPPREFLFMDEETKSRFTDYSMTSSVMRRNEQLSLLDDRFEKFYEQFDDDEIGALDNAELEGYIEPDSERLQEIIKDYFIQKEKEYQRPDDLGPKELPVLKEEEEDEEEGEEEMETLVVSAPEEKWDCETVISTYSNIYNRPKVIQEPQKLKPIRVSQRTGIPLDVLPDKGPTAKQAERMGRINDSDLPRVSTQQRDKDESPAERKSRKQAIREERKERRVEKKSNKMAFKEEKVRQEKQMLNLRTNVQGMKL